MADLAQSGSSAERAMRYREHAQRYRDLAKTETVFDIKRLMLELARQYDDVAQSLEALGKVRVLPLTGR
jgi:hypothetical protein